MAPNEEKHNDTAKKVATASARFARFLTSERLRNTPERYAILEAVCGAGGHFDAESIHSELESNGYHVSKVTVYHTLDLLCRAQIIRKLIFDTHQARYEMSGNIHSHLICLCCGEITEVNLEGIESQLTQMDLGSFVPNYVSTCVYGLCGKCHTHKV